MDIPILTKFVNGLKLFWASKRLRWLTLVFILGAIVISILGSIGITLRLFNPTLLATLQPILVLFSGIWPMIFLITTFLSLFGLQRFVASDEDYKKSIAVFIPWMIVSGVILLLFIFYALSILLLLMWFAFLGWIFFQSYFSVRTSLSYADTASGVELTRVKKALITASHIFCYISIGGAFVFTWLFVSPGPGELFTGQIRFVVLLLGAALAFLYNFLNGFILRRYSNKPNMMNIALVGLFVSLYASYFIYNAGKGPDLGIDFVGVGVSVFFLLYTMSSVGTSLASRADLDTRWKISKEFAATFTFFLASGYFFLDSLLPITAGDPVFGAALGDIIKLYLFPFIALIMELLYLRKIGKALKPAPEPEEIPIMDVEEEPTEVEEPAAEEFEESFEDDSREELEEPSEFEYGEESEEVTEYEDSEVNTEGDSSDEDYS
jgi:hypothetical protein